MTQRSMISTLCGALILAALVGRPAAASKFSYDDWNKVLSKYVNDKGMVNYEGLAKDRAELDRFVAAIEKTSPKSNPEFFPTKNDKLAYYLNAYNAHVFKGVLSRGPEKESVWSGGLLGGTGYKFFAGMDILIGGEKTHLKTLEDKTIRENFKDPRVHAALNCASKGCPRLPQTAFDPEKLDAQLDAGMTEFVAEKRNVTIDDATKTVKLSKIFEWFSGDFVAYEKAHGDAAGNQIAYVNRYRGSLPKVPPGDKIKFFEYDKSINKQ